MPRPEPHPLALFSLVPLNDRAKYVLRHTDNSHLISTQPGDSDLLGIDIGFHINSSSRSTIATLGRSGDVVVDGPSIARVQCSFEIHEEFGTVILYDRSHSQSTQVFGERRLPFEPGRVRRVAIAPRLNSVLGMGGVGSNLFEFKIVWHQRDLDPMQLALSRVDNPRLARTVDETPTAAPSARFSRIHTPSSCHSKMRYARMLPLGRGQFGEVYTAIEAETGRAMAVKIVKRPGYGFPVGNSWTSLKREVETLAQLSHRHIVEYIGTQQSNEQVEIFMALKDGSVEALIDQGHFRPESSYVPADILLRDVLMGIDYLESVNVVHRDLKPANILFIKKPTGDIHFQIADFGLCNYIDKAQTYVGSPMFMAPEVLLGDGCPQTSKMDVWALFVTIVYVMDVNNYRSKQFRSNNEIIESVLEAAKAPPLTSIKDMAILDPAERASAAGMLRMHFNGEGISTLDETSRKRPLSCPSPLEPKCLRTTAEKDVSSPFRRQITPPLPKPRPKFAGIAKTAGEKRLGQSGRPTILRERTRAPRIPVRFPGAP